MEEFTGEGVSLIAFIFTVLTTVLVSWLPQIVMLYKEWKKRKLNKRSREERRQILIMELLDNYYSLNFNRTTYDMGDMEVFIKHQDIMYESMDILSEHQSLAKELDFSIYQKLFDIKKEIRAFLELDPVVEMEIGSSGYPEPIREYPPENWLDRYNEITEKFRKLESELKPLD